MDCIYPGIQKSDMNKHLICSCVCYMSILNGWQVIDHFLIFSFILSLLEVKGDVASQSKCESKIMFYLYLLDAFQNATNGKLAQIHKLFIKCICLCIFLLKKISFRTSQKYIAVSNDVIQQIYNNHSYWNNVRKPRESKIIFSAKYLEILPFNLLCDLKL